MGREVAEDLTAEAFVRLAAALAKKPGSVTDAKAAAWAAARNLLVDWSRKASTQREVSWEKLIGPNQDSLDHLPQFQTYDYEDSTFADGLDRAVRELEFEPQQAFILGELRGLTSREAGPVLGVSHVTAAARKASASDYIRRELGTVR